MTFSDFSGAPLRPCQGRSAYARFLPDEKSGKESPKAGPSPALWNPPRGTGWSVRHSIFSPWPGEVTWMACRSMGCIYFSAGASFYRQGFTLVSRCSQLPDAWLPAAGTPHPQSRPGHGNRPAIGPAAQGAWCGGRNRGHSKGNGPNIDLTQFQTGTPRVVLRGERPKRGLVSLARSTETHIGERVPLAGKHDTRLWRRSIPQSALRQPAPFTQGSLIDRKKDAALGMQRPFSTYSTGTTQPCVSGMVPHWMPVRVSYSFCVSAPI